MKHGGLKHLERRLYRLTSRYKTDVRRGREKSSKPNVMWIQCIFRNDPCSLQSRKGGSCGPICIGSICSRLRTLFWIQQHPHTAAAGQHQNCYRSTTNSPCAEWSVGFLPNNPLMSKKIRYSHQSRRCSRLHSAGRFCSAAPENPVCTGSHRNNSIAIMFSISRDIFTDFTSCASVSAAQPHECGCCSHR